MTDDYPHAPDLGVIPPTLVPVEERERAEKLWQLLDDIDTASDAIKPHDLVGFTQFYEYVLQQCEKRHQYLKSDGYTLTDPETT